jgi:transcriptional regulator with XRE-family HTH domain
MPSQRERDPDPLLDAFGSELRFLREAADLSRNKLAEALGCTGQWIGAVEFGDKPPSEEFAIDLDTFFKTGGLFHRLWEKIKKTRRRRALPQGFPGFLQLEAATSAMWIFEAQLVTGLLQTEDYARDVLRTVADPDRIEDLLAIRMGRQKILDGPNVPRLWVVMDEVVLHRPIGGAKVMYAQLQHLAEVALHPKITLQVIAMHRGSYAGLEGSFTILSFQDGPDVAYVENSGTGWTIREPHAVNAYDVRFDLIRSAAKPDDESLDLIMAVMEKYA